MLIDLGIWMAFLGLGWLCGYVVAASYYKDDMAALCRELKDWERRAELYREQCEKLRERLP